MHVAFVAASVVLTLGAIGACTTYMMSSVEPTWYDTETNGRMFRMGLARRSFCDGGDRRAVVTLLNSKGATPQNEYLRGAKVLGASLAMYAGLDCSVETVVLVPQSGTMSRDREVARLLDYGWDKIVGVPDVDIPQSVLSTIADPKFRGMFIKLNVFNMTKYDYVLYLDADTLAVGPLMPAFDYIGPVMDFRRVHLGWVRDQPKVDYPGFNAGVMLVMPNHSLFKALVNFSSFGKYDTRLAEQGALNSFFQFPEDTLDLGDEYNVNLALNLHDAVARRGVVNPKIIHFTTVKPFVHGAPWECVWRRSLEDCRRWFAVAALVG